MVVAQRISNSGVTYGVYTLNDFLDGTLPPCKVYIFANSEAATAIWQYAPGFIGPNGTDINRASTLTGIQLAQSDGFETSSGVGLLLGYSWGIAANNLFSPRLVVTDAGAEVLGRYQLDNQVSTAGKKVGKFRVGIQRRVRIRQWWRLALRCLKGYFCKRREFMSGAPRRYTEHGRKSSGYPWRSGRPGYHLAASRRERDAARRWNREHRHTQSQLLTCGRDSVVPTVAKFARG
jgi:hypothetical protein